VRVLVVEDEPYLAAAIGDGLRLEAIAANIAADRLDDKAPGFGLGTDDG
jgi:DNA-binding response OmpR family regulator